MNWRKYGQTKYNIIKQEVYQMERKEKGQQFQEKNKLKNAGQTDEKEAKVKSEKIRYKNADSIYDI
jgi:hypothetical protein